MAPTLSKESGCHPVPHPPIPNWTNPIPIHSQKRWWEWRDNGTSFVGWSDPHWGREERCCFDRLVLRKGRIWPMAHLQKKKERERVGGGGY